MSETDPLPAEADPADLAEQQRSAAPDEDGDELGALGDVESSEADAVEQRLAVPDADDDEEPRA